MLDPKGNLVTLVGFDPSGNIVPLQVDANGYVKIYLQDSGGGAGTMLEPKGKLVTPVGFDPSGNILPIQLTAEGYLRVNVASPTVDVYVLSGMCGAFNPTDSATYYIGNIPIAPTTVPSQSYVRAAETGILGGALVLWNNVGGTASSGQDVSAYLNNLTTGINTLIGTIGSVFTVKEFYNDAMSVAITAGDKLSVSIVCPVWVTNPTSVKISWQLFIGAG